ncbi:MAG: gliding motility-associated C-terminal domain-containing protein, partial [Flavobacteriales bacterium]
YENGFNISEFGASDGAIETDVQGGTPGYIYNWSVNSLDGTEGGINLAPGAYELAVTDANGCVADTLIFLTEPSELSLPTGLSPNGDGANDTYVILGIDAFPDNEFKVFNRWGNVVYEKSDYNNEWGGESKSGEMLPDATYFVVFVSRGLEFNTYVDLRR